MSTVTGKFLFRSDNPPRPAGNRVHLGGLGEGQSRSPEGSPVGGDTGVEVSIESVGAFIDVLAILRSWSDKLVS